MKNFRFDLSLFSEGGNTSGCAAEQSADNSTDNTAGIAAVPVTDGSVAENCAPVFVPEESGHDSADSAESAENSDVTAPPSREQSDFELIAEALGVEADDRDGLIGLIRSRRERNELFSVLREKAALREYAKLLSESERLSSALPGFDLKKELSDSRFASMVNSGLSLEEAFRAVHFDELMENAMKEAQRRAVKTISKASFRPDENGSEGHSPVSTAPDVGSLTGKGIRDILRRVEKGAKVKF